MHEKLMFDLVKVAEHSFQEPIPNSPLLLSYLSFGARFCVGFPTLCQAPRNLFIYLFVHEKDLLVMWFLFGIQ